MLAVIALIYLSALPYPLSQKPAIRSTVSDAYTRGSSTGEQVCGDYLCHLHDFTEGYAYPRAV